MNTEAKEEKPMTAFELMDRASSDFAWCVQYRDRLLEYCRTRTPSGEVVWAKICEWSREACPTEPMAPSWSELGPAARAHFDLLAIHVVGLVSVIARHFPTSAEPAVRFVAAERKAEDTIFERYERSGAVDPHRLQAARAVARIMEQSGVTLDDVGEVLTIEAPDEGDQVDGDDDGAEGTDDDEATFDDDGEAPCAIPAARRIAQAAGWVGNGAADDGEALDSDGGTAAGEPGPRPSTSEAPVDGAAVPGDRPPRRKAP